MDSMVVILRGRDKELEGEKINTNKTLKSFWIETKGGGEIEMIEGWINMTKKEKIQFINGYIIGFFISGIIIFAVFGYMGCDINARKYKKWFLKKDHWGFFSWKVWNFTRGEI